MCSKSNIFNGPSVTGSGRCACLWWNLKKLIHFQAAASKRRVNMTVTRYMKLGNGMPQSLLYNDK